MDQWKFHFLVCRNNRQCVCYNIKYLMWFQSTVLYSYSSLELIFCSKWCALLESACTYIQSLTILSSIILLLLARRLQNLIFHQKKSSLFVFRFYLSCFSNRETVWKAFLMSFWVSYRVSMNVQVVPFDALKTYWDKFFLAFRKIRIGLLKCLTGFPNAFLQENTRLTDRILTNCIIKSKKKLQVLILSPEGALV